MMENEKESCRKRIKTLQETKEELIERINPILSDNEKVLDLYRELTIKFNEIICEEAKFLV